MAKSKEEISEYGRRWRELNKEKMKDYQKKYYQNHKQERVQQATEWQKLNPEKEKQHRKNFWRTHHDKLQAYNTAYMREYRARKKAEKE